ncbi:MAG: cytochrome c [Bacteroidia bacterium]
MKISLTIAVFITILGAGFPDGEWEKSKNRGKEVFENYCVACHQGTGQGIIGAFPPLAKSDYLMADPARAARAIKFGQSGEIVVNGVKYNNYMAELGLEDQEIADVMNYIMNSWGNKADSMISVDFIRGIKE